MKAGTAKTMVMLGMGFEETGVRQGYEVWKKAYAAEHAS
jgi:hypothetical protein